MGLDCGEWVDGTVKNRRLEAIINRTTSNPSAMAQTSPKPRLFVGGACLTRLPWYIGATMLATLPVISVSNVASGSTEEFATCVFCFGCASPGWNKLVACMCGPTSSA